MKSILVTDTLFVHAEHEQQLRKAGFKVERIAKADPSEDELIQAIQGKVGYILGGVEQVTERVIDAADALKAIVLCGSAFDHFIPAWKHAQKKNITIATTPDGHTNAVAEWAQAAALAMNRGLFGQNDEASTHHGLEAQTIGIIGLGRIGGRLADMLRVNRPKEILYYSAYRHKDKEATLGLHYKTLPELLAASDVVFLCVSGNAGKDFFGRQQFAAMKPDALLVSFMVPGVINADDLFAVLRAGKVRAISDFPMDARFAELLPDRWHSSNACSAFNTFAGLKQTSSHAVQAMIGLLTHNTHKPIFTVDADGAVTA